MCALASARYLRVQNPHQSVSSNLGGKGPYISRQQTYQDSNFIRNGPPPTSFSSKSAPLCVLTYFPHWHRGRRGPAKESKSELV